MKRNMKLRAGAGIATVALLGGAAFVASGATGAYFSDTASGTVSGSVGSVLENTGGGGGGNGLDLSFTNLLPGVAQSVTANFANSGTGNEDFYITFPNTTALSALNSLGEYGQLHISSSGTGAVGDVFDSANLKDTAASCGTFTLGYVSVNNVQQLGCWPLPNQLEIASNVAPGGGGSVALTFNYASKLGGSSSTGGGTFNQYPISAGLWTPTNTGGQTYIVGTDGSGYGLPYDIVATQPGITPGAPGTKP